MPSIIMMTQYSSVSALLSPTLLKMMASFVMFDSPTENLSRTVHDTV